MVRRQPRDNGHGLLRFLTAVMCGWCLSSPHGAWSENAVRVPESILDAAEQHLVSRVGEERYLAYFRFNPDYSRYVEPRADASAHADRRYLQPYYSVVYEFRMPQHGFVDEQVHCTIGALGALIECRAVPDCVAEPEECRFTVDEERARQLALARGLAAGIRDWRFSFHWHHGDQTYIWTVSNTLEETPEGTTGEAVAIDANSGVVYRRTSWSSSGCG